MTNQANPLAQLAELAADAPHLTTISEALSKLSPRGRQVALAILSGGSIGVASALSFPTVPDVARRYQKRTDTVRNLLLAALVERSHTVAELAQLVNATHRHVYQELWNMKNEGVVTSKGYVWSAALSQEHAAE